MAEPQLNNLLSKALGESLSPQAFALRPVRIDAKRDRFIIYEATTFPDDPFNGCELMLRRCAFFAMLAKDEAALMIDILNSDGDIIQDVPVNRQGFRYLRRIVKFKRVPDGAEA